MVTNVPLQLVENFSKSKKKGRKKLQTSREWVRFYEWQNRASLGEKWMAAAPSQSISIWVPKNNQKSRREQTSKTQISKFERQCRRMAPIQIIVRYYYEIMKLMQLALTAAKCAQRAGPDTETDTDKNSRRRRRRKRKKKYCKQMLTWLRA